MAKLIRWLTILAVLLPVNLFSLVKPAQAAPDFSFVRVNDVLPNQTVDGGNGDIQVDVSQACSGYFTNPNHQCNAGTTGRAIDTPVSYIKLYFKDPHNTYIRIRTGTGSSSDQDFKSMKFFFTPANADESYKIFDDNNNAKKCISQGKQGSVFFTSPGQWSDPIKFDTDSDNYGDGGCLSSPSNKSNGYYVYRLAVGYISAMNTDDSVVVEPGHDRWANFRIQAYSSGTQADGCMQQDVNNQGANQNFPCGGNRVGLWARFDKGDQPITLDTTNTSGTYDLYIPFATPCLSQKEVYPILYNELRWQDADGASDSSPVNPQIYFDLYYRDVGGTSPGPWKITPDIFNGGSAHRRGYDVKTAVADQNPDKYPEFIGGNGETKTLDFAAAYSMQFMWVWHNISYNNDPQIWIPYDSETYNDTCSQNSNCQSIQSSIPNPVAPGSTVKITQSLKNTGDVAWTSSYKLVRTDDTPVTGPTTQSINSPPIGPNQTTTFSNASYVTPATPGVYRLTFQMGTPSLVAGVYDLFGDTCAITIKSLNTPAKVYLANFIHPVLQFVRDNFKYPLFNLQAYMWPDAGNRGKTDQGTYQGNDHSTNFWLAGTWGSAFGDTNTTSENLDTDLNSMSVFNNKAEIGCPASFAATGCLQRIPLAYVPKNDGTVTSGSSTPGGNKWQPIRDVNFSTSDSNAFDPRHGGIACQDGSYFYTDGKQVWDCGGSNHINAVEISNLHINAQGIKSPANNSDDVSVVGDHGVQWQGGIDKNLLQRDTNKGADPRQSLPDNSAGPVKADNSPKPNTWDNVRNPQLFPSTYSASINDANFTNQADSDNTDVPTNFTLDPDNILKGGLGVSDLPLKSWGTTTVTSLLQDSQDNGTLKYKANNQEPLTYTTGITHVDNAQLKWDEYVNWSQLDDKGHWYPTKNAAAHDTPIGVKLGGATNASGAAGFTYSPGTADGTAGTTVTLKISNKFIVSNFTYYLGRRETKWGWLNPNATIQGQVLGQDSYFGGGFNKTNPTWADGDNDPATADLPTYWQDSTTVTTMDNSGDSTPLAHGAGVSWAFDRADPLYTNRMIYDTQVVEPVITGFDDTKSGTQNVTATYWPGGFFNLTASAANTKYYTGAGQLLQEDTANCPANFDGECDVTYDGTKDGLVNVDWGWSSNVQRARYESTFKGHTRDLGSRDVSASKPDNVLYGIESDSAAKPDRGVATIYNPTISFQNSDVYAGGKIDSYFAHSLAQSAFLYTKGLINHFDFTSPGVSGHPSQGKAFSPYALNTGNSGTYDNANNPIYAIWGQTNYNNNIVGKATNLTKVSGQNYYTMDDTFTLANGRTYYANGNLNLGDPATHTALSFAGGAGTIVVNGDLIVNGDVSYNGYSGTDRSQQTSVGFIVTGNIIVKCFNSDDCVSNLAGNYFANGAFSSGTSLVGNNDRVNVDQPLTLNGLIIASSFNLQRQPGTQLDPDINPSENFVYDGTVVSNPPPWFSTLNSAPAVWNEAVPSN